MNIMNTLAWLKDEEKEKKLYSLLQPYFNDLNEKQIEKYLQSFGMYPQGQQLENWIKHMEKIKALHYVKAEGLKLQKKWSGPAIPIFLFPCDERNRKIQTEYKGRAGVAFRDKLFLFVSSELEKSDMKPLLIHEYHHVCRLEKMTKKEDDFTILDMMIMEGLAENAVREELGDESISSWAKRYSDDQCSRFYERLIKPIQSVSRENPKVNQLLYGTGFYPSMTGYAVGYYLVKKYMKQTGMKTKELLGASTSQFLGNNEA